MTVVWEVWDFKVSSSSNKGKCATGPKGSGSRIVAGLAGAALVVGLPSAGLALGLIDDDSLAGRTLADVGSFATFTPASADPALARMIESRNGGTARLMRFTPAGAMTADDRSVTVVVRVDGEAAQAISVRNAIGSVRGDQVAEAASSITPSRYNLGLARGYRSFAEAPALSQRLSAAAIPDLSEFEPTRSVREEESRFAARIALEEDRRPAPAAPQSIDSVGDQRIDVAGSYRLTRNLDVRAGVRYEQDRNRLSPLPNVEQQDSQAVYVGTQFRF